MSETHPYDTIATLNGTDAADTITFTATSTTVNAGEGVNTITGTSGDNHIISFGGADTISLTSGRNTILAGEGANTITATLGNNVISSGDGADTITVTSGNNTINAGGGANTIVATSGINVINTGGGADTITTGGVAGGGNTINAGDGANTITTGAGDDTITGGNGADTITTGAGNDVVHAGDGANTVTTGAGNDIVYSGVDTDTITTGAGDDEIHIKGGTDTIAAGAGNDTLIADFSAATGAVSINTLAGNVDAGYAGNISGLGIATFAGVENFEITSGGFDDVITTGDGTDVVHAGGGSDIVNLAGGDDEAIYTMGANVGASDVYKGGDGVDTLTLEFTEDEWLNGQFVQTDIANYLEFQEANTGGANSALFQFTAFDLSVSEFEALNVIVDGVALDPTNDAPIAVDDTLNGPPSVLFIDDDRGLNGEGTWITTMTDLGYSVDYEAISSNGDPTSDLSSYDLVIWSNGDQDTTNLTTENITSLSSYLDQGGNLLYAGGHNLYNEPNAASFASNYLGVANYTYNMPYINSGSTATGVGGNYTLNPWSGGSYGGTMISAFTATTATSLMELNGWNASQNDIAAINQTGIFSAATFGFDINQLGVAFQADFLAATLAPIGLTGSLTDEDTAITIPSADILGNDTDIDGDVLVIAAVEATSVAGAAVTLNGDGSVFYDPAVSAILDVLAEGEAYVDTFSYTVSDGNGGIDTATVSVTLIGINDGPPAGIYDVS
jgi:Ca2+-binding RTX toxin-like protein